LPREALWTPYSVKSVEARVGVNVRSNPSISSSASHDSLFITHSTVGLRVFPRYHSPRRACSRLSVSVGAGWVADETTEDQPTSTHSPVESIDANLCCHMLGSTVCMKGVKNSSNAMTTRVEYINKGEYHCRLQTGGPPNNHRDLELFSFSFSTTFLDRERLGSLHDQARPRTNPKPNKA